MKRSIQPRKKPQQARSQRTREEILEATARLLNHRPLGEVSTNHIARKTGISVGTLYKYYPNKDSILADLSLMYMRQDAELFGRIFEEHGNRGLDDLLDALVDALLRIHKENARVRGVVYQNLERLKLVTEAQSARRQIHARGTEVVPGLDPAMTWVAISAVNAAVHAMSQLPRQQQNWGFVQHIGREALGGLIESTKLQSATGKGPAA
ncbi:MAG TPA: TetR/AcrR family transcriptional regulator [Terracidiphilus sp.]|jgi:AcrR family transcriptional regulator|nr:TetR/AcrR family transcriptional regulator [Terracidiphilus sp.]